MPMYTMNLVKKLKIEFPSPSVFRNLCLFSLLFFWIFWGQRFQAHASYKLSDERGQLSADKNLPDGWTYHKNIMGLPHVFLKADNAKKGHSSLSITFSGHKLYLDDKNLKKKISEYKNGRKKWAKSKKAKIKSFYDYEYFETKNKMLIHIVGFKYSTPYLKNMIERSIYLNCPDKSLIHFKAILLPEHHKEFKAIKSFLESIASCKKKEI